jgi:hypothetical protein
MSPIIAARLGWAAQLMCCPQAVLRVGGDTDPGRRWLVVARVLSVRHVAQGCVERRRRPHRIEVVAVIDGLHAATGFGFGLYSRWHRCLAFTDAGVARRLRSRIFGTKHAPSAPR